MNFINPYKLFNLDTNCSLTDLRKKYYNFAKLCHPDKGGSENDMIMIHNSYLYIKNQLLYRNKYKNKKIITNFKDFILKYKQKPPSFKEIWLNSDDYQKHILFNKKFEKIHSSNNFISGGYGHLMEKKYKYNDDIYKEIIASFNFHKNISLKIYYFLFGVENVFHSDLIIYNKPSNFNDNYYTLSNKKIKDYTSKSNNITLSDYKLAYSSNTFDNLQYNPNKKILSLEELKKQRNDFINNLFSNKYN